ncbi:putative mitochondrial protein [Sesamum angolense]|uniref:Mitochondrial protein n=1 Tax=Sesamum angolense TaxID=2727404 RepID=A0AAE1WQ82_9LAMI|nr:putative mitochondrial protein [Sesamum angolense]
MSTLTGLVSAVRPSSRDGVRQLSEWVKRRTKFLEDKVGHLLWFRLSLKVSKDIVETRKELERLAAHEETIWKHHSKVLWLREGDRNTGFFYRWANTCFQTNLIKKLKNSERALVTMEEGIQGFILVHFGKVYASNRPLPDAIAKGIDHLRAGVDFSTAEELSQPYTTLENHFLDSKTEVNGAGWLSNLTLARRMTSLNGPSWSRWITIWLSCPGEGGLRQGDPLSPYLFLLCTESFSAPLQNAEREGRIRGIAAIREALETYRGLSGQEINFSKSSVGFSRNTKEDLLTALSLQFGALITLLAHLKTDPPQALLDSMNNRGFGLALCLCWTIWWCRNGKLMQGSCLDPPHVTNFAAQYFNVFLSQDIDVAAGAGDATPLFWNPPPPRDCIKVNFDGATLRRGLELGTGVIARNTNGDFVAWFSRCFLIMGNAETAKAMAAREAIRLALRRGWSSIIIEGDCYTLIQKLRSSDRDLSVVGPIVMDIQELAACFHSCAFQHVKRSCNRAAHCLAQVACAPAEARHLAPPAVASLVQANISWK